MHVVTYFNRGAEVVLCVLVTRTLNTCMQSVQEGGQNTNA